MVEFVQKLLQETLEVPPTTELGIDRFIKIKITLQLFYKSVKITLRLSTLKQRNIRFQTLFPAKLRVFYEDNETRLYQTLIEATKDIKDRTARHHQGPGSP